MYILTMNILLLNTVYDKLFTERFEDAKRGNQPETVIRRTQRVQKDK